MRATALVLLLCCVVLFGRTRPLAAQGVEISPDRLADSLEAVFEAVLDKHIEPPTRQEMVLALLRYLHQNDSAAQQAALSRVVSDVTDKQSLYALMRQEVAAYSSAENVADLQWLAPVLRGGIRLESPNRAEVEKQLAANRYVGIGVQLSQHGEKFVFGRVMENGTAAQGGIVDGDRLINVDGTPATGSLSEVVDRLRGPEGSRFKVTVQTQDEKPRDVELRRSVVFMKTVKLESLEPNAKSAKISIENIRASTVHELQLVIEQLPASVAGLEIEVRFDGNFHYFQLLADALFDEGDFGEVVTRTSKRTVRTEKGNILEGRLLSLKLTGNSEQKKLLSYLVAQPYEHVLNYSNVVVEPVYLQESFPILDGQFILSLATRRFQRKQPE